MAITNAVAVTATVSVVITGLIHGNAVCAMMAYAAEEASVTTIGVDVAYLLAMLADVLQANIGVAGTEPVFATVIGTFQDDNQLQDLHGIDQHRL